jgi:hypothetical protein
MTLRNQSETEAVREGLADRRDLQEETIEMKEERERQILAEEDDAIGLLIDQGIGDLLNLNDERDFKESIYRADTLQGLKTETGEQFTSVAEYQEALSNLGNLSLFEQDMARLSEKAIQDRLDKLKAEARRQKEGLFDTLDDDTRRDMLQSFSAEYGPLPDPQMIEK